MLTKDDETTITISNTAPSATPNDDIALDKEENGENLENTIGDTDELSTSNNSGDTITKKTSNYKKSTAQKKNDSTNTVISVRMFPSQNFKVTDDHVFAECVRLGVNVNKKNQEEIRNKILRLRDNCIFLSQEIMQDYFQTHAKEVGLTLGNKDIKCFDDLRKMFKLDGSDTTCEKVWQVMIGKFDLNKKWTKDMEQEIMKRLNLEYDKSGDIKNYRTYAIGSVCCQTKVVYLKKLNKAVRQGHNRSIGVSRPEKIIKIEGKNYKREPGAFRLCYINKTVSK
jgi:hypothetical protein